MHTVTSSPMNAHMRLFILGLGLMVMLGLGGILIAEPEWLAG